MAGNLNVEFRLPRLRGSSKIGRSFVALLAMIVAAGAAPIPSDLFMSVRLAPRMTDGRVVSIDVSETFDVSGAPTGSRLMSLPIVAESVPGVLSDPSSFSARDATGPLALDLIEDPVDPTGEKQDFHWSARRTIVGPITITYRAVPRVVTADTKPGALLDMRSEASGIYGSTRMLLALPDEGWPRRVHIAWDLSAMPAAAKAVSSFGEGDTTELLNRSAVQTGFFMAGPWQKIAPGGGDGFEVYYLTPPDFDLADPTQDVAPTYRYAAGMFRTPAHPFRVFMRTTDRFQGGGNGGYRSFIFGTVKGAPRSTDEMHYLFNHEMLHEWMTEMPKGPEALWFVEGATDYYSIVLPYRTGHRTLAQVAAQIGKWTTNYYANPRRSMSDEQANAAFWSDTDAQLLAYSRGALYIALVDARLRAISGGKRRVDDLVRVMTEASARGEGSEALWLSLISEALGERGKQDFADLKTGRMLDLPADLFGPCFRRRSELIYRYAPGLTTSVDADGRRVVTSVRSDSAASAAGVRPGAVVENWTDLDAIGNDPGGSMLLKFVDGGGTHAARFAPWATGYPGFSWTPTSTHRACRL